MHRVHAVSPAVTVTVPVCCSLGLNTHDIIYSGAVLTYRGQDDRSIIY